MPSKNPVVGKTSLKGHVIAIHGLETKRSFVINAFIKYSQPVKVKIKTNG
jgi:hypothetical protein